MKRESNIEITKEPVLYIDATPDKEYPLRILRAYRQNCDVRWASQEPHLLIDAMNEACDRRAKILDKAIAALERANVGVHDVEEFYRE